MISVVVNVDTRPERDNNDSMFNGVVSRDFLVDGLINKKKLFRGFDHELIVFVDEHEMVDEKTMLEMRMVADMVIARKHNKKFENQDNFPAFNDLNYLTALFAARGEYIFHFDGDVAAFTNSPDRIQDYINALETYDYVSYPSLWSPYPTHDDSFENKFFCSTRFFCCKRSTLDFGELLKCQLDYDYWVKTYPVPRKCHWTEHTLSSISYNTTGRGVLYPPCDFDNFILFTWGNYHKYTLQRLNSQTFEQVRDWVYTKDFHYPNDITI